MSQTGKFLYLVPKAGMSRSAYHLRAARHDEINNTDYYTLSRSGITHFLQEGSSEFTPLDAWEREYSMYNTIRDIPFFRSIGNGRLLRYGSRS